MSIKNNIVKTLLVLSFITSVLCFGLLQTGKETKTVSAEQDTNYIEKANAVVYLDNETKQHFSIYFNENFYNENVIGVEQFSSVTDNILINGKSVTEINNNGKKKPDKKVELKNGIKINIWGDGNQDNEKFGLHFFIDDMLYQDYKLKLDDKDSITFKSGLSYGDFSLQNDIEISYYETINDWKRSQDVIDNTENGIINMTAPIYDKAQDLYFFCVELRSLPTDKFIGYADYGNMLKHILFNDKTFSQLNKEYGEHSAYVRFQTCEFAGLSFEGNQMYITLSGQLVRSEKLDNTSTISFLKGLVFPSLSYLASDTTYYYNVENNYWLSKKSSNKEYEEIKLVDVSNAVFDNASGSYYIVLYFDKDLSFHYLPQVNAETSWLASVYNESNEICYYSFSFLQALIYDNIRSSVKDYIYFNGKSIGELCERETKVQKDQSIAINYCGTTFNSKAIQIGFNPQGDNAYNPNTKNVIEIKKGFLSPLYGKTEKDYKFIIGIGADEGNNNQSKSGCGASLLSSGWVISAILILSSLIVLKRRKV